MIDFQTLNQLFLTILALMLASLFVSTVSLKHLVDGTTTAKFWRLSLGSRAASYLFWAALPIAGPLCGAGANMLFIFSAGCMALLFRSWRTEVSREALMFVVLCALLVGGLNLVVQRAEGSYLMRLFVTGCAGLVFSAWELIELLRHARKDREPLLKLIIGMVVVQQLLGIATVIATLYYSMGNQGFLPGNSTKSIYATWCALSIHLVIYLVIGSYLYRKAFLSQRSAMSEKDNLKTLLNEREKLMSSLVAANRVASSGALSASLTHELSQPLTAVLMQLGLIKHLIEKKKETDPTLIDLLKNALQDISHSKQILENMRAIFQQNPRNIKPCDPEHLVSQTVTMVQRRMQESNIRLVYSTGRTVRVEVAEVEIQQVLINLLNNAIDSLDHLAGHSKTLWIDISDAADNVIISVSDNGSGVPPELANEVFELAKSGKDGGMGIGLWIAKHIVEERHQGRLWLDTLYAPGARFVMELPKHAPRIESHAGNSIKSGVVDFIA